eukprot:3629082-Amphidinium_carterae.1
MVALRFGLVAEQTVWRSRQLSAQQCWAQTRSKDLVGRLWRASLDARTDGYGPHVLPAGCAMKFNFTLAKFARPDQKSLRTR